MPKYHAFLSHSKRYATWTRWLAANLEKCLVGRRVWFDESDLASPRSLTMQLHAGVADAEYLILLVTPEAMASEWVGQEWQRFADAHSDLLTRGRLIVVHLVKAPVPSALPHANAIDFGREEYPDALARLVAMLEGNRDPRARATLPDDVEKPPPLPRILDPELREEIVGALAPFLADEGARLTFARRILGEDRVLALADHEPRGAASAALVHAGESKDPEAVARNVLDRVADHYGRDDARVAVLVELRDRIPERPATAEKTAGPLDRFRDALRASPPRPIELFPEAADSTLDQVHVEIDIERATRDVSAEGKRSIRGATTLAGLLCHRLDADAGVTGRWLVLGEPGAGKSTIARHLEWKLAKAPGGPLPVYASLAQCAKDACHPFDVAAANVAGTLGRDAANDLVPALHAASDDPDGRGVWLLLDGLDEVSKEHFVWIKERMRAWSRPAGVRAVVLSRPIDGLALGAEFPPARLKTLPPARQRRLLVNWLNDELGHRVADQIDARESLKLLAGNPLLLTLIASIALARERAPGENRAPDLPANRRQLYDQAIDTLLLRKHKDGIGRADELDVDAARRALEQVALALQESETIEWTDDELKAPFKAAKSAFAATGDPFPWKTLTAFLKDVSDVLVLQDRGPASYHFLHRQFREYLAARALLAEGRDACLARVRQLGDGDLPRWAEVYGLLCGLFDEPLDFLRALHGISPALVRRALPDVEGVPPRAMLDLLVAGDEWDAEDLWRLAVGWGLEDDAARDRAAEVLGSLVAPRPKRSLTQLAYVHHALERIGRSPDRKTFFETCGLPIDAAPVLDFVPIPAGGFEMGSDERDAQAFDRERPRHHVDVPRFELARTTVTRAQYRAFDPDHESTEWKGTPEDELDVLPVTDVSWWHAWLFCRWTGARLPSEAEWEFACRAGTDMIYSFGDNATALGEHGWYFVNSGVRELPVDTEWDWEKAKADGEWGCRPHAVGQKAANPLGLHDMHGNVYEWCEDTWHDSYEGAPLNGSAWVDTASEDREIRGGSFRHPARYARSAGRYWHHPAGTWDALGFRPARSVTSDRLHDFTTLDRDPSTAARSIAEFSEKKA